jgi:hypothetical protein
VLLTAHWLVADESALQLQLHSPTEDHTAPGR